MQSDKAVSSHGATSLRKLPPWVEWHNPFNGARFREHVSKPNPLPDRMQPSAPHRELRRLFKVGKVPFEHFYLT
ncbi:MAG: hypothetical protein AMXMBFR20_27520 [Planctomycetia bacterium]